MSQPLKGYVNEQYLAQIQDILKKTKQRTYQLMALAAGQSVLDLGCGPGTDTITLASIVGESGRVVGVDHDLAFITQANNSAIEAKVSGFVQHYQADVAALPFEDGTFDASRSDRVFQHLLNPEAALKEMLRVTKPGGRIVVMEPDRGTLSFDTDEIDIERRLVRFFAEQRLNNGYAGRKLFRQFKEQPQLEDVTVEAHPQIITNYQAGRKVTQLDELEAAALAGKIITPEELERWHRSLEEADTRSAYYHSINMIIVWGRKGYSG